MQENKKSAQLFGLILSSILAIGLIGIPAAQAAQPDVTSATLEEINGKIKLTVTADGSIPKSADDITSLGFGFAWLDGDEAIVVAIHPGIDDSNQNPNAWHTHTVEIDGDGCVSVSDSQGGVKIKGDTVTLQLSNQFVGNIEPTKAASFELVADESCDSGAKVNVLSGPIDIS